ncbi:gorasp2-prov protein [Cardiosporidium cionae]|uniref:Gorasp2-prov protein n=1 Tax=Cardiosporidium cionae TaxID=476202 RepID=A0ABQ7JCG6_9APIC|nr:gorasp2-prov protein [Cardiosporidium cionae]|eukprot:KAF8821679.1 gorasp2-prov protein [Cardiosporidium cionae]
MGNSASKTTSGGFRIIRVNKNGPADKTDLEVFFDFIVEAGGRDVTSAEENPDVLRKAIEDSVNKPLKLVVYSARLRRFREVYLTPSHWNGQGFLGAGVQFESVENAMQEGLRVIEVFQNSPAASAGLIPYKDFLIATELGILRTMDDLVNIVSDNINKEITLLVFNANTEKIREVKITANYKWGGSSRFGCDIGTGYLHRLPLSRAADLDLFFNFVDKLTALSGEMKADSPPQLADSATESVSDHKNLDHIANTTEISGMNEKHSTPPYAFTAATQYHPHVLDGAPMPDASINYVEKRNDDNVQEDVSRTDFSSNSRLLTGGSTQASSLTERGVNNNAFVAEPPFSIQLPGPQKQEKIILREYMQPMNKNETASQEPLSLSSETPHPGILFPIEAHHGGNTPLNIMSSKYQDN